MTSERAQRTARETHPIASALLALGIGCLGSICALLGVALIVGLVDERASISEATRPVLWYIPVGAAAVSGVLVYLAVWRRLAATAWTAKVVTIGVGVAALAGVVILGAFMALSLQMSGADSIAPQSSGSPPTTSPQTDPPVVSPQIEPSPNVSPETGHSPAIPPQTGPAPAVPPQTARPPIADPSPGPEFPRFPWPPPRASSLTLINIRTPSRAQALTLGQVDDVLSSALSARGYSEKSYFAAPAGFALVTRLEQTTVDGTPKPLDERWAVNVEQPGQFSVVAYLEALFTARPGFYRVIVFVVTSSPFSQSQSTVTRDEAIRWLGEGFNILPAGVAEEPFTDRHQCTALVYEFEQSGGSKGPVTRLPGRLTVRRHLEKAALLALIE